MALRGNLKDFSLPDVFQLVAFSRKTGVLRIVREDGSRGSVWFRDGDVFFASSDRQGGPIGQRLVDAQHITPEALAQALELQAKEPPLGRRLGQILVEESRITEAVLQAFVSEQIQDTIFDLMRWEEGVFDFETMRETVDEDIGLSVSIENVIMEGARRLDEWNRIRRKIPSDSVIFKMATAPGEGTLEISLKPIEWQMLLLIDGTRSVRELTAQTKHTDFEIAKILYGLFSAGLLDFATDEEVERNLAEKKQREGRAALVEFEQRPLEDELGAEPPSEPAVISSQQGEVPTFLDTASMPSGADDLAVLQEFMGAVLRPAEPAEDTSSGVVAEAEPLSSGDESPVVGDMPFVQVPSVEELKGVSAPSGTGLATPVPPRHADDQLPDWMVEPAEGAPIPEWMKRPDHVRPMQEPVWVGPDRIAPTAAPQEPEPEPEPEMPSEPERVAAPEDEGETEAPATSKLTAESTESQLSGFVSVPYVLDVGDGLAVEVIDEGLSVEPASAAEAAAEEQDVSEESGTLADLQALVESLDATQDAPEDTETVAICESVEAPDFSELLESLDVDAEVETDTVATELHIEILELEEEVLDLEPVVEPVEPEPEAEALEPEAQLVEPSSEVVESAGARIRETAHAVDEMEPADEESEVQEPPFEVLGMGDLGFSEGLGDELSALTGAGGRKTPRPTVMVNKLPDEDGPTLRRDTRVDRETLLKIIDGITNL